MNSLRAFCLLLWKYTSNFSSAKYYELYTDFSLSLSPPPSYFRVFISALASIGLAESFFSNVSCLNRRVETWKHILGVADVDRVRYDRHRTRFRASINLRVYDKVYRAFLRMVGARGYREGKVGGISSCRLQGSGCGIEMSRR